MYLFNDIRLKNYLLVNPSYKIIMFSHIALMALDQITLTDDETPTTVSEFSEPIPRPMFTKAHYEPPSESFLSVLDDKNRTITSLKQQLQNQKMQLSFYIKKELDRTNVDKFSESCTPQASEESLPLNLAINKFCRQAGIKTKLSLLHEHMNRLDYKISNLLRDQEFVLRKIVNKLCEFVKCQESSSYVNFKAKFGSFITDHVDLFDSLLGATIGLSGKLNSFKICCDRVHLIEEERNSIVEQVYSMPVEERINRNYLVGIQMEKAQLENEIRRISRHQEAGRHRINELNVIENILHNLQWELNSSFLNNEESCISKMVKKINSEARILLEMTKEQKRRFECEISKTKCPDSNRILLYIKTAADSDKTDKKELERCGIKTEDEIRLFETVQGEVDVIKNKIRQEAEKENKKLQVECGKLKNKMTQVLLDSSRTKVSNGALKQELEELKSERKKALQKLKQERDVYKSQVEDLQAIREAYAQLVDRQPDTLQMERDFFEQIDDRDRKILGLQNRLSSQNQEVEKLKVKVFDQNDQISVLKRFINLTRHNSPREDKMLVKEQVPDEPCCSRSTLEETLNTASEIKEQCIRVINRTKEEETDTNVDNVSHRNRRHSISPKRLFKGLTKHYGLLSTSKKKSSKNRYSRSPTSETAFQSDQKKSLSCLKIFSQTNEKTNGKSDVVTTMVTTNEKVNGDVTRETASVFSMEIRFSNGEVEEDLLEHDEFELFKDCSTESFILESRGKTSKNSRCNK